MNGGKSEMSQKKEKEEERKEGKHVKKKREKNRMLVNRKITKGRRGENK